MISSLRRPFKRFNSSTITPSLPPTPIANSSTSHPLDPDNVNSKQKGYKKNNSRSLVEGTRSGNSKSNLSIHSNSGGSSFSLNNLIKRKKLKGSQESLR